MNRKTILSAICIAALAATGTASAHTVGPTTLGGVSPGTVDLTGVGVFGAAFCQNLPAVGGSLPFFCGVNGLGVFFDVSGIDCGGPNEGCGAADRHSHANGNCKVVQGTQKLNGDNFFFSCGTDRNDDNFVTDNEVCDDNDSDPEIEDDSTPGTRTVSNHDECTGESAVANGGVHDGWADDWVDGTQADQVNGKNFCFQDDVTAFTPADDTDDTGQAGDDVTALNQAFGSWDDFVVFVGVQVPGPVVTGGHVGDVTVTLSATGAAACANVPNNWVSAHNSAGNTRVRAITECDDGFDNADADTLVDEADPECQDATGVYQWWDNDESA